MTSSRPVVVLFSAAWCLVSLSVASAADSISFDVTVHGGKQDGVNIPVRAWIDVPEGVKSSSTVAIEFPGGQLKAGQLTPAGIGFAAGAAPAGLQRMELHFIVPEIKAGTTLESHGTIKPLTPDSHRCLRGIPLEGRARRTFAVELQ